MEVSTGVVTPLPATKGPAACMVAVSATGERRHAALLAAAAEFDLQLVLVQLLQQS